MRVYLLKNKIVISFTSVIPLALKVYVCEGQILTNVYYENNIQQGEIDCGLPLFNSDIMGDDTVNHLKGMLKNSYGLEDERLLAYSDAQVELFNTLNSSQALSELYIDCPNLAWAIILDNYYGYNSHVIEFLCRMKRKLLISVLAGIPPREKIITLLKKVVMLHGTRSEFGVLSKLLNDDNIVDDYRHAKMVTIQELYLASRYRLFSGTVLLNRLCQSKKLFFRDYKYGMPYLERLVKDSITIGQNIGIKKSRDIVMGCNDLAEIKQLHDRWTLRLQETTKFLQKDIFFEEPSINICEGIKFINSVNGLVKEGKEMNHCLASYKTKALSGESYIYKFSGYGRERVTIELGLSNGVYILKQAKGYRNSEPSNIVLNYIHTWLERENKDLQTRFKDYQDMTRQARIA